MSIAIAFKMDTEKCNINWHTYSDHLRDMLYRMKNSDELTDVTLVCDDKKQFKAHKIVLSACSSVFKSIINNLPLSSSVIYLRGIKHQEIESILEFMYLGVATLHQESIDDFLNVAKNLEIKEIGKDFQTDDNSTDNDESNEPKFDEEGENISDDNLEGNEPKFEEDCEDNFDDNLEGKPELIKKHSKDKAWDSKTPVEGPFFCDYCDYKFSKKRSLDSHRSKRHTSVDKYCNICDYTTKSPNILRVHIQSKHEGVKWACNQCDHQALSPSNLGQHIKAKHEGVKYSCNQCNFQCSYKSSLKVHIEAVHDRVRYKCKFCDHQFSQKSHLKLHIESKHKGHSDEKVKIEI